MFSGLKLATSIERNYKIHDAYPKSNGMTFKTYLDSSAKPAKGAVKDAPLSLTYT
ncbi:unnamed protein product [Dovyalis caffra]|uniref:Uncharacterized protein n=1 Tax=Dovyalis caffra TaxID=77055 RepID=A0AAV1QU10_9ROSI|nr:unnamed protein product [Dovyalis caffra]